MTVAGPIFRDHAIKHVSSPEKLDRLVRVTTPRRWVGLLGLLVLVSSAVVWASVSNVSTKLTRPGYFRPLDGIWPMQAPIAGIVSGFEMQLGQTVTTGATLAMIQPSGGGAPVQVPSVVTGMVTEIATVNNTFVEAGQRLAVISPINTPNVVYSFIPTEAASGIPPGLPVRVLFGGGVGTNYGYALGHVKSLTVYPPTAAFITWLLPELPAGAIGGVGSIDMAVIVLDADARTPSGVAWGSGSGPPVVLEPGLPATVTFILGTHHPIDNIL